MRLTPLLVALAIAFPAASPVEASKVGLRLRVAQDAATGDFTVKYDSQAAQTDYWCAAGRYVTRNLGLPDNTRIYRVSPPPRKAGKGITFSLDPARSSGQTGVTTFGGPQDGSMSAAFAFDFCFGFDLEEF